MEEPEARLRHRDDVRFEELDGEAVVYDPTGTQATSLNETAAAIWKLCDGSRTTGEIAGLICAAYPEAADSATSDIHEA